MAFGRELKDFVEAFKAGSSVAQGAARLALQEQQIKSTEEYRKAAMDLQGRMHGDRIALGRDQLGAAAQRHADMMKFRERSLGASLGLRQQQLGLARQRLDLLRQQSPAGLAGAGADATPVIPSPHAAPAPVPANPQSAPRPVSALPVSRQPDLASADPDDQGNDYASLAVDDEGGGDDDDQTQAAHRGGMIRAFEDGGYVDEGDEDDGLADTDEDYGDEGGGDIGPGGAIPSQVTPPQAPAQPRAANTTDLPAGMALHGAVTEIQRNLPQRPQGAPGGQPQGAIPAQRDPVSGNFHQFIPKFSDQDYAEFMRTIDPDNKLGPAVREIAGVKAIYDFYLRQGNVQKAEQAAAAMVMRASEHSMRYGAAAERAIRNGQFRQGADLLRQSYDNVPDGRSAEAEVDDSGRGMLVLKDAQGNVISRNPFGPQQMLMAATGMKNGTLFWQELTGAAHRYLGNTGQPTKAYQDAIAGLTRDAPVTATPRGSTAADEGAPEEAVPTSGPPTPPPAFDPAKVNVAGMRPSEAADYRLKMKARHQDSMSDYFQRAGEYLDGLTPQVKNTSEDDEYVRPTRSREQEDYLTKLSATPQGRAFATEWRKRWDSTYVKPYEEWKKAQHEADKSGRTKEPTYDQIRDTTGAVDEKMEEIFLKPFDRLVDSERKDGALVGTGKPFTSAEKMREALGPTNIRAVRDIAARLAYFGGIPVDTALEHTATLLSANPTSGALRYQTSKPNSVGDVRLVLADGSTFKIPQTLLAKIDTTRGVLMEKVLEARAEARKGGQSQNTFSRGADDVRGSAPGMAREMVDGVKRALTPVEPGDARGAVPMVDPRGAPLTRWLRKFHVDPSDPNLTPEQRQMLEMSSPPAALPGVSPRR